MGQRLELHALLKQILASDNVYHQPPATLQMSYPCIVYQVDGAESEFAGNKPYMVTKRYQITVIDRDPDSQIRDRLVWLDTAIFNRHFTANNLHHDVFTLYF